MLAMTALQGTGLLHAFHLAVEHAPPSGHGSGAGHCGHDHGGSEPAHTSDEATLSLRDSQGSDHGHGHHHDPATCPVCQVLVHLKAVSAGPSARVSASLPSALKLAAPESFPLTQIALSTLGPRAPPASV
jgi:hypothetical protein